MEERREKRRRRGHHFKQKRRSLQPVATATSKHRSTRKVTSILVASAPTYTYTPGIYSHFLLP